MSNNKYICIHGHFYQPPRENPWLDLVEQQESAKPYHDWNERINFECYAPNAVARVLDADGEISQIRNNYKRISFNFGPTLLSWMEAKDPKTYALLQEADVRSMELFGGHGNALAQAHSHLILPLCNYRDKVTQVQWGIRDFERRFNRYPEGMWLAETAVDTESLEVLAAHGIRFTILAPRQAQAIRKMGDQNWSDVNEHSLDTRRPYWVNLPSGRRIALFFYNGDVAKDVAFNRLLNSGKAFTNRLMQGFSQNNTAELVHIATDGESYGHHHRHGEMALAHSLWQIEDLGEAKLTNYAQYLDLFPPEYEVKIWENSSWSCVHGVERWRSNCGCNAGHPGWNQLWREPLRKILNGLRDDIIPAFEKEAARFLVDPWAARNAYIDIINDRSEEVRLAFLKKHQKRELSATEATHLLRLMEMQKHCLYMFTSCAWFFDEISGIETNQVLQYALRAIEYAETTLNLSLKDSFVKNLEQIPSNAFPNAAESFKKNVLPARVNLDRVAMHSAAQAIFTGLPMASDVFNYIVSPMIFNLSQSGSYRLATGVLNIHSKVTQAHQRYGFAVLHLGAQHIIGNLSKTLSKEEFVQMQDEASTAFNAGRLGDVFGVLQQYFGPEKFTITSLFKEEQIKIINQIADKSLRGAFTDIRESYQESYPLMVGMQEADLPIPEGFTNMANFVLKNEIRHFYENDEANLIDLQRFINDTKRWKIEMKDELAIERAAEERIFREVSTLNFESSSLEEVQGLMALIDHTLKIEGLTLALWKIQNHFYKLTRPYRKENWAFRDEEWEKTIRALAKLLNIRL